jgi:hypothetical protein
VPPSARLLLPGSRRTRRWWSPATAGETPPPARLRAASLLAQVDRDTTGRLLTNGWVAPVGAGSPLRGWVSAQPGSAVAQVLARAAALGTAPVLDVRSRPALRWMAAHRRGTLVAALLSSGGYQGNGQYLLADAATVQRAPLRYLARVLLDSWAADTLLLSSARTLARLKADVCLVLAAAEAAGIPRQRMASEGLAEYLLGDGRAGPGGGPAMPAERAMAYRAAGVPPAEALAVERGDPAQVPTVETLRALAALRR